MLRVRLAATLVFSPAPVFRPAAASRVLTAAPVPMGQALSILPGMRQRGVAAAAKAGKAALDRPSEEDPDLWMICGLGNPGTRYEDTRHNVGFMTVDALARQESISVDRLQENAAVGRGRLCGKKVLLVKPMTFMNVSGEAVGKLARFYRIPAQRILVVYDDLDLPTAAVRLRAKGGHGGHNGMKSISSHLQGTKDFPRIRIGIGRPPGSMPVPSYVLQDFSAAERQEIDVAVQESIDIIRSVLTVGMDKAVSGMRVDRDGKPIPPPHSNGKGVKGSGGGGGKEGQPPAAKKQRKQGAAAPDGQRQAAEGAAPAAAAVVADAQQPHEAAAVAAAAAAPAAPGTAAVAAAAAPTAAAEQRSTAVAEVAVGV